MQVTHLIKQELKHIHCLLLFACFLGGDVCSTADWCAACWPFLGRPRLRGVGRSSEFTDAVDCTANVDDTGDARSTFKSAKVKCDDRIESIITLCALCSSRKANGIASDRSIVCWLLSPLASVVCSKLNKRTYRHDLPRAFAAFSWRVFFERFGGMML